MKSAAIVLITVSIAISQLVVAEESQWYIGMSAGQSEMRGLPTPEDIRDAIARETDISGANFPQKISMEDTDTAWKLYAGYWLNAHFGLELSYADLGEGSTTWSAANVPGFFAPISGGSVSGSVKYSVTSLGFTALARYPFTQRFSIYAKAGAHYYDAEAHTSISTGGIVFADKSISAKADENGTELLYGVGVAYDIGDHWGVRGEWELYSGAALEDLDIDVEVLSAGLHYRF